MVSRNTTLVPSLGLRIGPACEAGLSAGMRRERVSPQIRKKEDVLSIAQLVLLYYVSRLCYTKSERVNVTRVY